jgi:hypothetical protein
MRRIEGNTGWRYIVKEVVDAYFLVVNRGLTMNM